MHDLASLRILSAILVASAAAAGCATDEQRLDYTVSGGLIGHGDGTAASVDLHDGHVILQLAVGRAVETTLAPAELASLRHLVHEANFPALEPVYDCSRDGLACNDSFILKLAVVLDGETYEVAVDDRASRPPPLHALLDTVYALTHPDPTCLVDPTVDCAPRAP